MSENDALGQTMEKLQGYVTLALTVAARVIEVAAHRRRQQMENARRQSEAVARQVEAQQRSEVASTRLQLRDVGGKEWWDRSSPEEVANAYATARAYGQIDPELHGTARFMAEEIQKRYGVDADVLVQRESIATKVQLNAWDTWEQGEGPRPAGEHPDPDKAAEIARRDAAARARADAEWATAAGLVAEADTVDAAVHADGKVDAHEAAHDVPFAETGWDEAGRREALASRLQAAQVPPDAAEARTVADRLQAKPAAAAPAATQAAQRAPKARNTPVRGAERTIGR